MNLQFHLGQVGKQSHALILHHIKMHPKICMPENTRHFFLMKQSHLALCLLYTSLANIVAVLIQERLRVRKQKEEDKAS